MDLNKFDEPFSPEDIEWRIQQSGKTRDGKVWAIAVFIAPSCFAANIVQAFHDCPVRDISQHLSEITVSNKDSNLSSREITANHL